MKIGKKNTKSLQNFSGRYPKMKMKTVRSLKFTQWEMKKSVPILGLIPKI